MRKKGILAILVISFLALQHGFSFGLGRVLELHLQYRASHPAILPSFSSSSSRGFSDDLWFVFAQAKSFLQTNIPLLLEQEPRAEKLSSYLRDGNLLLQALQHHQTVIALELQGLEAVFDRCEDDVELANQLFSTSVSNNNESGYLQAVSQAQKARVCMGENVVLINANRSLKDKSESLINAIQLRVDYLQEHQEKIVDHYEILKPSLLSELHRIAVQLGQE